MDIDNNRMRSSQKFSMGHSKRAEMTLSKDVPGPGNYENTLVDKKHAPKYGMGTAPRDHSPQKSISPGPGSYALGSIIGSEGSKSTMHARIEPKSVASKSPGPGSYENTLRHLEKAPSYGMGMKYRDSSSKLSAGPGASKYNPSTDFVLS